MGDPSERNGHGALTRVLFCGPYWPASTNYTREYLQDYPFIQVGGALYMVLCKRNAAACICSLIWIWMYWLSFIYNLVYTVAICLMLPNFEVWISIYIQLMLWAKIAVQSCLPCNHYQRSWKIYRCTLLFTLSMYQISSSNPSYIKRDKNINFCPIWIIKKW
jgi:hypothetical protein